METILLKNFTETILQKNFMETILRKNFIETILRKNFMETILWKFWYGPCLLYHYMEYGSNPLVLTNDMGTHNFMDLKRGVSMDHVFCTILWKNFLAHFWSNFLAWGHQHIFGQKSWVELMEWSEGQPPPNRDEVKQGSDSPPPIATKRNEVTK